MPIAIRGLTKRYHGPRAEAGRPALDRLDLDVADGELLVVVGPSGCGKSTFLRLVAGLEEPSAGTIEMGGRNLVGVSPPERDVAMVFQGYALYPHLTVAQNIAFPLEMRKVRKVERRRKVEEVASLVGLSDKLGRHPAELSGGERQRVAMARAVVRSPAVFLFDEPLSNLDARLRGELRVELAALVRRFETTAIYVTHDQAEAMTMGDRVAVLDQGLLQQVDPPATVYREPANRFVAGFVGTPPMNLVELEVKDGVGRGGGCAVDVPRGVGGDRVVLGVRPEHLTPVDEGSVRGEVVAVEPLGPETLVYIRDQETTWCAREAGFSSLSVGDVTQLRVGKTRHWFDAESGARLAP